MANLRNEFEFRSALLTALGQEHTEAEAKNEEMWRRKMLDGLGVEYNQNDVNQFGLFREKLIEGVANYSGGGSGGGGSSDFSTAEVTISTTTEDYNIVRGCIAVDEEGFVASVPNISVHSETPSTVNFILYKGTAFATIDNGDLYNIETTGDIVNDDGELHITGNGTITISAGE